MSIVLVHSTLYILSTIITIYVSAFLYISVIKLIYCCKMLHEGI